MARRKEIKLSLTTVLIIQVLIILALAAAVKINNTLNKVQRESNQDDEILNNEDEPPEPVISGEGQNQDKDEDKDISRDSYRNIVIFGVDSRENLLQKGTNSDTIIVVSIHERTKAVKLVSIYRDTYSYIPKEGFDKINASYRIGGYSLALSTINKNFDLNIQEYITVNFKALVHTIDLLGGISLDITEEELKYLNGYVKELNRINDTKVPGLKKAGTQTVNGTQATAYARIRYTEGGDYMRTQRQRVVIQKIFEKVKSSDLATINKLIDELLPQVATNLSNLEILDLAKDVFFYDIVDQTGFPFEKDAHTYRKVSYVFPIDLEANTSKLHEFLFEIKDYQPSQTVKDYSAEIEAIRKK